MKITCNIITSCTQLKNFIQRANFDPVIDDNYFARAEEKDIEDVLMAPVAIYIVIFYAVGFTLALIITMVLLFIFLNTKRWDKKLERKSKTKKANKYTKSKIFSIALTTFFINLYALILDIFVVNIKKEDLIIDEHYVHALPKVVTAIDVMGVSIWITCWMLSLYSWINKCKAFKDKEYMFLALSALGPLLSLVIHLPYIAIAYV